MRNANVKFEIANSLLCDKTNENADHGVSSTGSIFSLSFAQLNRPQSELKLGFRRPHW